MKLKALKCKLKNILAFSPPKVKYEQYMTPTDIAALIVHIAETQYSDIKNKYILDLCCGTGVLSIAASFFEPASILAVDIDIEALVIAAENYKRHHVENVSLVHADISSLKISHIDTTIMNPPFGTREAHMDALAVRRALECSKVVYSLHKTTTRKYLLEKFKGTVLGKIKFLIPKSYSFHMRKASYIDVDLVRFTNKHLKQ